MILVVCKDDEIALERIAQKSILGNPGVFGKIYKAYHDKIPVLGVSEDLYIIAHGAFNVEKNPVIGDQSKDFFVDGLELWDNIKTIFPKNYRNNVYVDACESADHDHSVFSFIEVFYSQFNLKYSGMVYGKNGSNSGLIDLPNNPSWIAANLTSSHNSNQSSIKKINPMENQTNKPANNFSTIKSIQQPNQGPNKFRRLREFASKKQNYNAALAAAGANPPTNYVTLTVPGPDPSNQEAVKYYVFNQTGNIMMSSTDLSSDSISQSVRDVFNEVSVFFAAMTKAISTTIDPVTNLPYSIYNYTALSNIISGSGLFVHVTEEDLSYETSSFGADFSTQLIEGLLGLATGSGELAFAEAMIASMGSAGLEIAASHSSSEQKVANIIFICEYLLGMPIVSAMVVYCDMATNTQQVKVGACFSETTVKTSLTMHKDTFMFVTPKFISEYAGDLLSVESNGTYNQLVDYLADLVLAKPDIAGISLPGVATPAPSTLGVSTSYQINGECFGTTPGKLFIGTTALTVGSWNNNFIIFTTPATAISAPALINLFMPNNTTTTPDTSSTQSYSV